MADSSVMMLIDIFQCGMILLLAYLFLWYILDLRPPRKIQKATASKIKKAASQKRQRDSYDSEDVDYDPNPSELAAALQLAMLEMIPLRKMLREKMMTPLI